MSGDVTDSIVTRAKRKPARATVAPKAAAKVANPAPKIADVAPQVASPVVTPAVSAAPVETPAAPTTPTFPAALAPAPAAKDKVMNDTVKAFADKAQEQVKSALGKSKLATEELATFGKGNVEALVESSRIAAKGFETLGQDAAAYAKSSYELTATTLKSLASVSSPTEALKIQADYFRTAFDALVKEASRSTEATLKLAGEVAAPIQNRLALAADKIKVAA